MRANPTTTINAGSGDSIVVAGANRFGSFGSTYVYSADSGYFSIVVSGSTAGYVGRWSTSGGFYIRWSAEL